MQDRYVGDVGDFGKYGLLRVLTSVATPLRLGVDWYLVPCESHNLDGKHVGYLQQPRKFRRCDPELFDSLQSMFSDGGTAPRRVATIEASSVLPRDTVFHSSPLAYPSTSTLSQREQLRKEWLESALSATETADLVFVDPDNGIECISASRLSAKGPKYVFWSDLDAFAAPSRDQSMVIYHHTNRRKASSPDVDSSVEQVQDLKRELQARYPDSTVHAVLYTRGTRRAFFGVAKPRHRDALEKGIRHLFATPWRLHFKEVK